MLILRAKTALNVAICMIFYIFLDNGVMNTPNRRILSFVFTVLCFKKSLLIRVLNWVCFLEEASSSSLSDKTINK